MIDSSMVDDDTAGFDRKTLSPEEFARSMRQLAIDTSRFLGRKDLTMCEFVRLRRRFGELLEENQDRQHTAIERWLRNARQTLETKLVASSSDGSSLSQDCSWSTFRSWDV